MLHLNKLPLRLVFQNLDGVTSRPDSFSGPIGRQLNGAVSEWKVVKFKSISNPKFSLIPNSLMDDLFLIKVYFPGWFQIKFNNEITDGPKHYLNILTQLMGFQNKSIQDIAVAVVQPNAYFAHHENILLAMLADNDHNVRLLAVNKILSIRVSKKNLDNVGCDEEVDVRKFIIPKINTNSKTYYSLSSLNLKDMHEPPALKHFLNKEIEAFQQHKLNLEHPCHNQAVERHIKLVSEASAAVARFKNTDELIRQKIRSRKLMKTFNIKKQFNA